MNDVTMSSKQKLRFTRYHVRETVCSLIIVFAFHQVNGQACTASNPSNGAVDTTIPADGANATYTCNSGYTVVGLSTATCTSGVLGTEPTCAGDACMAAAPANGAVDTTTPAHGADATYTCDSGYTVVGSSTATCTGGTLTAEPTCAGGCTATAPANGFVDGGATASVLDGNTITFTCSDGYSLSSGSGVLTCTNGGLGTAPTCVGVLFKVPSEGQPHQPQNIQELDRTLVQAWCRISAATIRRLTQSIRRRCQALHCDPSIDYRGKAWNETQPGFTADGFCPHNYTGNVTRECSSDGIWLSPRYNCVREDIKQIQNKINELTDNSPNEDIDNVLHDMVSATTTTTVINDTLTEKEVVILVNSLDTVAKILVRGNVTEDISNAFVESESNLIDGSNKPTWKVLDEFNDGAAEQLVSTVGNLTQTLTTQLETSSNNETVIAKKHIVIEIKQTKDTEVVLPSDVAEQDLVTVDSSYIRIPPAALPDCYIVSAWVIFRNMSHIMPANTNESSDEKKGRVVNGPVIALTIACVSDAITSAKLHTITPPIRIVFEHSLIGYIDPKCSFWIFQSDSPGYWSNEGCSLVETNSERTICECDHLTNFAVLMSPFQEAAVDDVALRVVSIIGIGVSLLFLCLTLGIHIYLWRILKNDRVVILTHLCTALVISYVVFLAGVDRTEQKVVCALVAALLQYIYLVAFCIMLVEGIVIAIKILFIFVKNYRTKLLLALAWAVPAVITGISLGITRTEGYGNDRFCWLSVNNALIYAFVGPALAIILINVIVICLVIRARFRVKEAVQRTKMDTLKISIRSLCVLMPLMGVSWVLGILYINDNLYWMQYVFTVCNGLQGFFIFLIHCALNVQVKNALKEAKRRRLATVWTTDKTSDTDNTRGDKLKNTSLPTVENINNHSVVSSGDVLMEIIDLTTEMESTTTNSGANETSKDTLEK